MIKTPWVTSYNGVPPHLDYPETSMVDLVIKAAEASPDGVALEFMGNKMTYRQLIVEIDRCARALSAIEIGAGDRVTICLPNTPQAVILFYAINRIGAVATMIHPLSSEGEIEFYLKKTGSIAAVTLDAFFGKFDRVRGNTSLQHLLLTSIKDGLDPIKSLGFQLTKGRKIKAIPKNADVRWWREFMRETREEPSVVFEKKLSRDPAVILFTGGTSGTAKGIVLSNRNFNALAIQTAAMGQCVVPGNAMLAILPIFHGFGLGICIHTMLVNQCRCILVPTFNGKIFAKLLKKKKPNYIAGVPTLFEALLRNTTIQKLDLGCLQGVFCGGDSLSIELKKKVDQFLLEHNASVEIREGYGLTESVTASCLTPRRHAKEGSIGIPFPDTYYKIVRPGTREEMAYGSDGEICVSGPTIMIGYLDDPQETAHALQKHDDGLIWLHTGDLGMMDSDGYIYFKQRLKRMIISSGYSIYPSQLENVIDGHDAVLMSTVIGVDDPYKKQKVKAFVVLRLEVEATQEIRDNITAYCKKNIAGYAMPYEFEFRSSLPMTLVGKVAYTVLEEEERTRGKEREKDGNSTIRR